MRMHNFHFHPVELKFNMCTAQWNQTGGEGKYAWIVLRLVKKIWISLRTTSQCDSQHSTKQWMNNSWMD